MSVLVVDLARVLDESAEGKAGAKALGERWEAAKAKHQTLQKRVDGAKEEALSAARSALIRFEKETLAAIEQERKQLREALLAKVRPVVEAIAKERSAAVVIEASNALYVGPNVDVTTEVLTRL